MGSKLKEKEDEISGGKNLWDFVDIERFGRPVVFENPKELWDAACKYFSWCQKNPIVKHKVVVADGEVTDSYEEKKRAMTFAGLFVHAGFCKGTWHNYKNKPDFLNVTSAIEKVMFEQKFSGAASGEFNANIIARDLGLADVQKAEIEQSVTASVDVKADVNVRTALDDFKSEFMDGE